MLSKIKKTETERKRERDSAGEFLIISLFCLKYLMITKKSKGSVPYLYTSIKYNSITVYIKNKTGKVTIPFQYVPKE